MKANISNTIRNQENYRASLRQKISELKEELHKTNSTIEELNKEFDSMTISEKIDDIYGSGSYDMFSHVIDRYLKLSNKDKKKYARDHICRVCEHKDSCKLNKLNIQPYIDTIAVKASLGDCNSFKEASK